jgi:hypothetical protein
MCCTDVSICESHKNLKFVGLEDVEKKGGAHIWTRKAVIALGTAQKN